MGTKDPIDPASTDGTVQPPPMDLPAAAEAFFSPSGQTAMPTLEGASALDRLGSSPLPKSGFPFLGFMASLYEHVSDQARAAMEGKFVYVEPAPLVLPPMPVEPAPSEQPFAHIPLPPTPPPPSPLLRAPLRTDQSMIGTSIEGPEEAPGFYKGRVGSSRWVKIEPPIPPIPPAPAQPNQPTTYPPAQPLQNAPAESNPASASDADAFTSERAPASNPPTDTPTA